MDRKPVRGEIKGALAMFLYEEILAVALVVSAFLAVHFEDTTHAVISFGAMFTVLSALYFALNTPFAALFQLVIAVGTIAVFFLAGEMLTPKKESRQKLRNVVLGVVIAVALSLPAILLDLQADALMNPHNLSFFSALWEYRALDVIAQGVVILVLALGVATVLKERRKEG